MASLLADIFCLPSEAAARLKGVRAAAGAGVAFQPGLRSGLVISDSRSLVFQAALSAAARDRKVLVILCSGRWDSLPPTFHSKASPTTATMARLRFWYPTSITELLSLVCDDHTLDADTVVVADAHILVERSLEQEELGGEVSPEKAFVRSFARLSAVLQTYMSLCAGRREDRVLGREDRVMGEEEMALEKEDKLVGREVKVLRTKRELVVFSTFSEGARKGLENRFGLWYPEVWTETHQVTHSLLTSCSTISTTGHVLRYYLRDSNYYLESLT